MPAHHSSSMYCRRPCAEATPHVTVVARSLPSTMAPPDAGSSPLVSALRPRAGIGWIKHPTTDSSSSSSSSDEEDSTSSSMFVDGIKNAATPPATTATAALTPNVIFQFTDAASLPDDWHIASDVVAVVAAAIAAAAAPRPLCVRRLDRERLPLRRVRCLRARACVCVVRLSVRNTGADRRSTRAALRTAVGCRHNMDNMLLTRQN